MINHILVPLDGSTLAECVLPHVEAIAPVTNARITLLHVLQQTQNGRGTPAIDPVEWHLQKQNTEKYLEGIVNHLSEAGVLGVEPVILEGNPASSVIDFGLPAARHALETALDVERDEVLVVNGQGPAPAVSVGGQVPPVPLDL